MANNYPKLIEVIFLRGENGFTELFSKDGAFITSFNVSDGIFSEL